MKPYEWLLIAACLVTGYFIGLYDLYAFVRDRLAGDERVPAPSGEK